MRRVLIFAALLLAEGALAQAWTTDTISPGGDWSSYRFTGTTDSDPLQLDDACRAITYGFDQDVGGAGGSATASLLACPSRTAVGTACQVIATLGGDEKGAVANPTHRVIRVDVTASPAGATAAVTVGCATTVGSLGGGATGAPGPPGPSDGSPYTPTTAADWVATGCAAPTNGVQAWDCLAAFKPNTDDLGGGADGSPYTPTTSADWVATGCAAPTNGVQAWDCLAAEKPNFSDLVAGGLDGSPYTPTTPTDWTETGCAAPTNGEEAWDCLAALKPNLADIGSGADGSPYTPTTPADWTAAGCTVPNDGQDAHDCAAALLAQQAIVTTSNSIPGGVCAGPGLCIHGLVDGSNVVQGLYCAIAGETFATCTPGFITGVGATASPIGTVSCTEALCVYYESDAEIWWVSDTLGSAGWRPISTELIRDRFYYNVSNYSTTQTGRCAAINVGGAAVLCGTATQNFRTTLGYFSKRQSLRIKAIGCHLTAITGLSDVGDTVAFTVQEREGTSSPAVSATAKLTVLHTDTTLSQLRATMDVPLTLTAPEIELKIVSGADTGTVMSDMDGTCYVEVEY